MPLIGLRLEEAERAALVCRVEKEGIPFAEDCRWGGLAMPIAGAEFVATLQAKTYGVSLPPETHWTTGLVTDLQEWPSAADQPGDTPAWDPTESPEGTADKQVVSRHNRRAEHPHPHPSADLERAIQ